MLKSVSASLFLLFLLSHGCSNGGNAPSSPLKYRAAGSEPEKIAVYEAWFGHPRHISSGYSSHDPAILTEQIHQAQTDGISAFVVDWYGDREPFIDASYADMQRIAAKNHFHVAMMYDESDSEDDATDEAIADFTQFHDTYLSSHSPGHQAYLTYQGRPLIFIFPKGGHTDWSKVRALVDKWNPAPFLIDENLPAGNSAADFDGFYAWINPGQKGWAADGSNWGRQYLADFYETMKTKYPDKIIVGGAWAHFNDAKASWGLNRHISDRGGQTYSDTLNFWRTELPKDQPPPFLLVETWNDYEEGSAIERCIPSCNAPSDASAVTSPSITTVAAQSKP